MKIEKSKSKKGVGDLVSVWNTMEIAPLSYFASLACNGQPSATRELTQRLLSCSDEDLIKELKSVSVWRYGKVGYPVTARWFK